jgi:YesN/AraC family two-component response regulator
MNSKKILIVDDEITTSNILLQGLQMVGYSQVEKASNGLEGFEKYKTFHPDLVFMDMEMPVMNGYESSSKIKSFDPGAKILVVTGNPCGSLARRTLHEGIALTLLEKPLKLADLKHIISKNTAS